MLPGARCSGNEPGAGSGFHAVRRVEVFPAEATRIAAALHEASDEDARAALAAEQEEDEAAGVTTDWGDTAVEDLLRIAREFADYCGKAGRYGGFRVG